MIKEANSLSEIEGQLTRQIAVGAGPWWRAEETAKNSPIDMNWVESREKLEEILDWCAKKYSKQYDAIIIEHIQTHEDIQTHEGMEYKYRKWFEIRLSFQDPNAALEFRLVWG